MAERSVSRRGFLGASAAAAFAGRVPPDRWQGPADSILYDGDVHLVDRGFRKVPAIALGGGQVIASGTTAEVRRFAGTRTQSINLAGRTALPGVNDSHLHALWWAFGRPPFTLDLAYPAVRSIADIAARVGEAARTRPAGSWIQGRGWDQPYFAEGRPPTRHDLDRVSPDHPVILTEFSGHAVWVNSKAIELARVTRESVAPPGGVIVKDAAGEPTGVFFEGAAGLIRRMVPPWSAEDRANAFAAAMDLLASNGITSFTEPGIDSETLALYAEMAAAGRLTARLTALMNAGRSVDAFRPLLDGYRAPVGADPRWVRLAGIKIHADGIPTGNKTAWLHEPYQGGGNGTLVLGKGDDAERVRELETMVAMAHDRGWQIGTHATGDRALDAVIDAYQKALGARPDRDRRHYLIHADLISPEALQRMAALGVGANFNSTIKFLIADGQVEALGSTRAAYEWPYRTAIDAGVVVATGSDAPVTDGNWRQGIATCVTRLGKQSNRVSGASERITLDEAIRSHTAAGAWQDRAETWKGTLETGMAADLVVLDGTIGKVDPAAIGELGVTTTIVAGKVVFSR
ncbi:MAG: amidohydrolase [Gemmatimonadetes bacterium]|nr:amidohydrolase [Gemmatimonadota bacterium]